MRVLVIVSAELCSELVQVLRLSSSTQSLSDWCAATTAYLDLEARTSGSHIMGSRL